MGERSKEWTGYITDRGEVTALNNDGECVEQHGDSEQLKGAHGSWRSVKHAIQDGREQNYRGGYVRGVAALDVETEQAEVGMLIAGDRCTVQYHCSANGQRRPRPATRM